MPSSTPNILLITTDQQRTDTLSCYGSAFTHTPHLDRLAAEGARFDRAYCVNPVCTPARASIFSGQYLHRHATWNVGMNVPEETVFISHRLADLAYRTHYIGKAHFQTFGGTREESKESLAHWQEIYPAFHGPYYGFQTVELSIGHTNWGLAGHYGAWVRAQVSEEEYAAFGNITSRCATNSYSGEAYDWTLPLCLHSSIWTADRTISFLEQQDGAPPFLLAVGFQDPHHPHALPVDFTERVRPEDVPLPDYTAGELEDKPRHFREARSGALEQSAMRGKYWVAGQGGGADYTKVSEGDARLGRSYYYSMVKLIDQQVGRIMDALERTGQAENTLVIFTTDHGELLGDHGLWMKGPFHYEQLVRIPLIMRWPTGFAGGQHLSGLINQVDLAPTILAAIGQPCPAAMEGVDALPMLRGESAGMRDATLVECVDDPDKLRLKTIITAQRKLTWYAGQTFGELYDLELDPREKINRWDDAAYAGEKARLLSRLLEMMEPVERRAIRSGYC